MQITLTLSKNGKDKKKRKGQLKINALLNFFDAVELPPLPGIDPSQYTKKYFNCPKRYPANAIVIQGQDPGSCKNGLSLIEAKSKLWRFHMILPNEF